MLEAPHGETITVAVRVGTMLSGSRSPTGAAPGSRSWTLPAEPGVSGRPRLSAAFAEWMMGLSPGEMPDF
ncbi:MAG TPA: hypothetical protein VFE59_03465 [Trebonia sp.]|nr:hypothetical protein [Trebonia sp.]